MLLRRSALLVVLATGFAALAAPPAAQAHDTGVFAYQKWVERVPGAWTLESAPGCPVACEAHGYEHDDFGQPIPGRQKGQSWDCKVRVFFGPPELARPLADVLAVVNGVLEPVFGLVPPGGSDGPSKPPCPLAPVEPLLPLQPIDPVTGIGELKGELPHPGTALAQSLAEILAELLGGKGGG